MDKEALVRPVKERYGNILRAGLAKKLDKPRTQPAQLG